MKDPAIRSVLRRTELLKYTPPYSKIVEEMRLPVAGARIDIAVINGALHGYEIKGASDTLQRLPNQIKAYSLVFDYLTIVTEEKYCKKILGMIPDWVGVAICSDKENDVEISSIRQSALNENKDGFYVAKILWKEELMQILESHKIKFYKSDRCWTLCETMAKNLDINTLSCSVREILKARL